jgi:ribose transport system permease protein
MSISYKAPLRYRLFSARAVGELLTKSWIDAVIPFAVLVVLVIVELIALPGFLSPGSLSNQSRQLAEFGLMGIGLAVVMLGGGIDLSIGSLFALCVLTALTLMNVLAAPLPLAILATLATGLLGGAINGLLIGYLRLRAFITTLVTLVIFRSVYELIFPRLANEIVASFPVSPMWDYLGFGTWLGLPVSFLLFSTIALLCHIALSRFRIGWHIRAVGGSRKSAYNTGIPVRRVVFLTYVFSGLMTAAAALLFSARLGSTGSDTGIGLEILILTAVVLGGIALGGGRGSIVWYAPVRPAMSIRWCWGSC